MELKRNWLSGVADVELMFSKYDKENDYLVHSTFYSLPSFLKYVHFDAIIMTSTFMDRFVGNYNAQKHRWINQFEFLKRTKAKKIVFAQDDYWFSEIRDSFYVNYNIDRVHLVCPKESWPELVPKFIEKGGQLKQGFTTYVTPFIRSLNNFYTNWKSRRFDVVYRGTRYPKVPNHIGEIKGLIGDKFVDNLSSDKRERSNIDVGKNSKLITGDDWYKFVAGSRAILGSNSGSSVRLRNVLMRDDLLAYSKQNPQAKSQEIEEAVLDKNDRNRNYTGISPRNIEAAMLGTLQILVKGSYSNMLVPNRDYFPLKEDGSNADDAISFLEDTDASNQVVLNCKNTLLNNQKLDSSVLINETTEYINNSRSSTNKANFHNIQSRYETSVLIPKLIKDSKFILRTFLSKVKNKF